MARRRTTDDTPQPEATPAPVVAARPRGPQPRTSLKVVAVKDGFYPKDYRRRKGSVFTLQSEAHYSDSAKERILKRLDAKGQPIKTGVFGWMAWAEPGTPERVVTAEDVNNAAMGAKFSPADESVI